MGFPSIFKNNRFARSFCLNDTSGSSGFSQKNGTAAAFCKANCESKVPAFRRKTESRQHFAGQTARAKFRLFAEKRNRGSILQGKLREQR
jgi:hypothetical protein